MKVTIKTWQTLQGHWQIIMIIKKQRSPASIYCPQLTFGGNLSLQKYLNEFAKFKRNWKRRREAN